MASTKPKSAKPTKPAPVAEPDQAALLPHDLPAECPFQVNWQPAVCAVHAADGINLDAIKDAFKQLHVLSHITLSDLAARLDPSDVLCADLASAAAEGQQQAAAAEGASMPVGIAAKLLQRQFAKDQALAWKFELVRRRDQLLKAEADAQIAQEVLANAQDARDTATSRLEAVQARLPKAAPPAVAAAEQHSPMQSPNTDEANADGTEAEEAQGEEEPAARTAAVPPLNLQQLAPVEVVLSPEQRRALTDAQTALAAADTDLKAAQAAAAASGAALTAAQESVDSPFTNYELYWVEGLACTAAELSAGITAGIPLRAVVWLQPPSAAALDGRGQGASGASIASTRPASGASTRQSTSGGAAAAATTGSLPPDLRQLRDALDAAAWNSELSGLLVLQVPVEEVSSPFSRVPAGSSITDPAWAAASTAAAAAKAAAAAAASVTAASIPVPEAKAGSASGAKPGSAVAGAKTSSSGGTGPRPGSSVSGGSAAAAAAAAAPEKVLGCKELARVLLTVKEQAKRFDQWHKQDARVYRMPAPSSTAARSGYYRHLLDSVPPERHSVPLVLHAILEQVHQDSLSDSLSEVDAAAASKQAIVAAQVDDAINAAFSSLLDGESSLLQGHCQEPVGLALVQHGDGLAAATHGLTTGYIHGHQSKAPQSAQPCQQSGHSSLQPATSSRCPAQSSADWPPFMAKGLSPQDVDDIEQHMLQLLELPGLSGPAAGACHSTDSCRDLDVERNLQQAELKCMCQDVSFGAVQRWQVLQSAVAMLPAEVQAAHAADILSRRHHEHMPPHVLRQVLQHSSLELPDAVHMPLATTGAELVASFAGPQLDRSWCCSMPHAMSFHQYWELLLSNNCDAPDLRRKVYEMTPEAATQRWQQKLLYTDAGGIAVTGTDGLLALHQGPTNVRLLPPQPSGSAYQLVATLDHGSIVAATVLTAPHSNHHCQDPGGNSANGLHTDAAVNGDACAISAAEVEGSNYTSTSRRAAGEAKASKDAVPEHGAVAVAVASMLSNPSSEETAAGTGAPQPAPTVARAAPECATLCVVTPEGLNVQLNTDGCVLLAPVDPPQQKLMDASAVDILGAPLAAGKVRAQAAASASAWHALLPDGTLIKAAAGCAQSSQADSYEKSAAAADSQQSPQGAMAVLYPDGRSSQQLHVELPLVGLAADGGDLQQQVGGWLRTSPSGEQTWVVDAMALQDLRCSLAEAAQQAAAAAAAAAAEAAAAAAAAAEPTGRKGSKGDKKRLGKQGSSKPPKQSQQQEQEASSPTAPGGGVASLSFNSDPGQAAAAVDAALQDLEQQPPQSMGSIRAVLLTDADTGAVVTIREDHLLIVDYPDGSRLLQDAEGCRLSHVAHSWLFEAAGLPAVRGDDQGISLQPCPGVCLSWSVANRCVTLTHAATGAVISVSHTGHVVYSPAEQPVDAFLDACADLAQQEQQLQAGVQEVQTAVALKLAALPGPDQHMLHGHQSQQQLQPMPHSLRDSQLPGSISPAGAPDQEPQQHTTQVQARPHQLPDVCSQPACWGLLGLDLVTGEAALHEECGARIYVAPGGPVLVWNNGSEQQPNAAQADLLPCLQPSGLAPVADAGTGDVATLATLPPAGDLSASPVPVGHSEDDDLDDDEIAARAAATEAAATAARAAVEAAEAEAAAADSAATHASIKPVAPHIKPRVFVVDPRSGSGYEVLAASDVEHYAAAASVQQGHQHQQQDVTQAEEPGTICHTFFSQHACRSRALQPLPLAQPTQVLPAQVDPQQSLVSLRKVTAVVQAEWQAGQGLRLPRIATINPWHLSPASAGAASSWAGDWADVRSQDCVPGAYGDVAATRLTSSSGLGQQCAGGQVVVVREVLELPELGPEVQEKVQAVLKGWHHHRVQQEQLLASRVTSPCPSNQQQLEESQAVSSLLQAAGFTPLPPGATLPSSGTGADADQQCTSAAGSDSLQQVRCMLLDQQQAAAKAEEQARQEAGAKAAAEAAAKQKPYRPWVKPVGPYDHTPQRPEPGTTLKYFSTKEGLEAAAQDPLLQAHITRNSLPAAQPVQPASAGKQQVPGVYLSSSTALCGDDDGVPAGSSTDSRTGLIGTVPERSSSSTVKNHTNINSRGPSPLHAPLMHAGRPTKLGLPLSQQQHAHMQTNAAWVYTAPASESSMANNSSSSGAFLQREEGGVRNVYGQPRVVPPPLPATYSKGKAAGALNSDYLHRERATLRTTKTSSTNLVKARGKGGQQIVLRPSHLHFGTIPVGEVAHRAAKLLNGSGDVVRFTIQRPERPLRVLHKPGPIPPGMEAAITVELVAEHVGDFVGDITLKTELNVFTITVSAKVAPAAEQRVPASAGALDGPQATDSADGAIML